MQDDPDIAENESIFLGFNEPDQKEQSNIPPLDAAMLWKELEDKYSNKVADYYLIFCYLIFLSFYHLDFCVS